MPGITTSLNVKITVLDQNEGGHWGFLPFADRIYEGLLQRIEETGYSRDTDLFVAHYDWRKSNDDSATNYLKPTIDHAKSTTGAGKVDIIAHSMGGLVARSYIQGAEYDNDVDQLITLGTPHRGASDAYQLWEGGQDPERWSPFFNFYVKAVEGALVGARDPLATRPDSIRQFFPSIRDLLPLGDFAKDESGQTIPRSDLAELNIFLQGLEGTFSRIADRGVELTAIGGTGSQTLDTITLSNSRSFFDILLSRWRDGHPNPDPPPADSTAGDETVLASSALIGNQTLTLDQAIHNKLPEEAQEEVLEALGLPTEGPHIAYELPETMLGVVVLSPVDPRITCGDAILASDTNTFADAEYVATEDPNGPKLLVIADPPVGDCTVSLTGTDNGDYTAITTYADSDEVVSTTKTGTTTPGQTTQYDVTVGENTFIPATADICTIIDDLENTLKQLRRDGELKPLPFARLLVPTKRSHAACRLYQRFSQRHGSDDPRATRAHAALQHAIDRFRHQLSTLIERDRLTETAAQAIAVHDQALADAGF